MPTSEEPLPRQAPALFEYVVYDEPPVVFALVDEESIEEARNILESGKKRGVMGVIVKQRVDYNPSYSYHLDPASIEFFEYAVEVCDSTPVYVEEHLDEVGGDFLPDSVFCPWNSQLTRELSSSAT